MSQLEAEREDLCAKIQAGEGETALLNQLKEKNNALQGQVSTSNTLTLLQLLLCSAKVKGQFTTILNQTLVIAYLKVTQLTDKLKNQSESNKQAQDNLHEQVQEQKTLLRSAQDRAHTLETSVSELTAQLTDSKDKVSQLDAQVCHCIICV